MLESDFWFLITLEAREIAWKKWEEKHKMCRNDLRKQLVPIFLSIIVPEADYIIEEFKNDRLYRSIALDS